MKKFGSVLVKDTRAALDENAGLQKTVHSRPVSPFPIPGNIGSCQSETIESTRERSIFELVF